MVSPSEKTGYHAYINSSTWKAKRLIRLEIDGHCCQTCGHDGSDFRLEVHHKYDGSPNYGYKKPLGEEDPATDLITLCVQCHDAITNSVRLRRPDKKLPEFSFVTEVPSSKREVISYVENPRIKVEIDSAVDSTQRTNGRPIESLGKSAKSFILEAQKDGSRDD